MTKKYMLHSVMHLEKKQLPRKPWLTSDICDQGKKKDKMFSKIWNKKIHANTLSMRSTEITKID